jgi:hypothetical protein
MPSVRLACVKRAASVRSEPGSNSQIEPPDTRPKPGTREDPGTFYTGRKQIPPSTASTLPCHGSERRTHPRSSEDAQTAKTPPAHPLFTSTDLSKEQPMRPPEQPPHIRSVRKHRERAPRRNRHVVPTNQPIKRFFHPRKRFRSRREQCPPGRPTGFRIAEARPDDKSIDASDPRHLHLARDTAEEIPAVSPVASWRTHRRGSRVRHAGRARPQSVRRYRINHQ